MKLFPKSFRRRRLFEKRQHPKTFLFINDLFSNTLSQAAETQDMRHRGMEYGAYDCPAPSRRAPSRRVRTACPPRRGNHHGFRGPPLLKRPQPAMLFANRHPQENATGCARRVPLRLPARKGGVRRPGGQAPGVRYRRGSAFRPETSASCCHEDAPAPWRFHDARTAGGPTACRQSDLLS
ncbi:hypothetical protein FYB92_04005 [Novacetimonas sp. GS1]